jgi:hypothetical protein
VLELSTAQKIEQLELRKQRLLHQKNDLQAKIDKAVAKVNVNAINAEAQK